MILPVPLKTPRARMLLASSTRSPATPVTTRNPGSSPVRTSARTPGASARRRRYRLQRPARPAPYEGVVPWSLPLGGRDGGTRLEPETRTILAAATSVQRAGRQTKDGDRADLLGQCVRDRHVPSYHAGTATCTSTAAPSGDVVDLDAPLGQLLLDIPIRASVAQAPADRDRDHLRWEPEPGERRPLQACRGNSRPTHPPSSSVRHDSHRPGPPYATDPDYAHTAALASDCGAFRERRRGL
jgi:hypothetical protein